MQLVYSSNGSEEAWWYVDSVRTNAALRPGSICSVIHQRRQPDQAQPEEFRLCLANDTLFSWHPRQSEWRPQRPVGPAMVLNFTRATGSRVRYETGKRSQERIQGLADPVPVIHTIVTTMDSTGRPMRRLRELYAIGLLTAIGGEFEVPDSTEADGWRNEQTFRLQEIRTP